MVKTYTIDEIKEMASHWVNYPGFSGETCCKCGQTANILGTLGWICDCGQFNAQDVHWYGELHANPKMGPSRSIIRQASGAGS